MRARLACGACGGCLTHPQTHTPRACTKVGRHAEPARSNAVEGTPACTAETRACGRATVGVLPQACDGEGCPLGPISSPARKTVYLVMGANLRAARRATAGGGRRRQMRWAGGRPGLSRPPGHRSVIALVSLVAVVLFLCNQQQAQRAPAALGLSPCCAAVGAIPSSLRTGPSQQQVVRRCRSPARPTGTPTHPLARSPAAPVLPMTARTLQLALLIAAAAVVATARELPEGGGGGGDVGNRRP